MARERDGVADTGRESLGVGLCLSGTIDVAAERARYAKDLSAAFQERDKTAAKLANPSFTEKAPGPVVAKTRDRLLAAESDIARIEAALAALPTA